MNTPNNTRNTPQKTDGWTVAFFALAATGALVGQSWAGALRLPGHLPMWAKFLLMAPVVAVVEIGGVAMATRADRRRRLGENAYGYRVLSATVAVFAVLFNWFGHYIHNGPSWWSWLFAGLSALGYSVWLLLSGDRRRDALRAARKLPQTAPAYGLLRWLTAPRMTRRARTIALERGVGLFESLHAARQQVKDEQIRAALAPYLRQLIAAKHPDPLLADIAATLHDLDRLAEAAQRHLDYEGWGEEIGSLTTPARLSRPEGVENKRREAALKAAQTRRERQFDSLPRGAKGWATRRRKQIEAMVAEIDAIGDAAPVSPAAPKR